MAAYHFIYFPNSIVSKHHLNYIIIIIIIIEDPIIRAIGIINSKNKIYIKFYVIIKS